MRAVRCECVVWYVYVLSASACASACVRVYVNVCVRVRVYAIVRVRIGGGCVFGTWSSLLAHFAHRVYDFLTPFNRQRRAEGSPEGRH